MYYDGQQDSEVDGVELGNGLQDPNSGLDIARAVTGKTAARPNVLLSTWEPSEETVRHTDEGSTLILVRPGQTVALIGVYSISIKQGTVSLGGSILNQNTSIPRVFALSTHAIPIITGISNGDGRPCEVVIQSIKNSLQHLKAISPLFTRIHNEEYEGHCMTKGANLTKSSYSYIQNSSLDPLSRLLQPLDIPKTWTNTFDKLSRTERLGVPRALVCGAKNAGKSTFARALLNHFIFRRQNQSPEKNDVVGTTTVCYLDLDPGQPEFSPPGQVSLVQIKAPIMGPPFTHAYPHTSGSFRIIRAHALTATSPKEDPQHCIMCAKDLMQQYIGLLRDFPLCPLIVNTAGWIQGEGLDLLCHLIKQLEPSASIFLSTEPSAGMLDPLLVHCNNFCAN